MALGLAALLGACASCAAPVPWRQLDLAFHAHSLEALGGGPVRGSTRRQLVPLGPPDLRQLVSSAGTPARDAETPVSPGRVLALLQPVNTRARFSVTAGDAAFVEFRPRLTGPSSCVHRVIKSSGGQEKRLWESTGPPPEWPPAEIVQVPLTDGPARQLDLLFELECPGQRKGEGLWASPKLFFRDPDARPRREPGDERPNLVLIGADTLRADALGAYGRAPSLTPAIDALAEQSDVWLDGFSTFNITVPSFTSILTGLYGREHGVYHNTDRAPEGLVTIAEVLGPSGYATGAFLAARHVYSSRVAQGFEEVSAPQGHQAGEFPVNQAMNWLQEVQEPFFAWVHLYDAHTPHAPPGKAGEGYVPASPSGLLLPARWTPFREPGPLRFRNKTLMAHEGLYDGEVVYLDRQIDRLLDVLRSRDGLEHTIVALVADHGENLGENGFSFHHAGLWDSVVHVPLMIRWAGRHREGRRLPGLVQTIDLFPTLLRAAGFEPPVSSGQDLLELAGAGGRRAVFAEQVNRRGPMVRTRSHKFFTVLHNHVIPAGAYLYDLQQDPGEDTNLARRQADLRGRLSGTLAQWSAAPAAAQAAEAGELNARELEELRSLGYATVTVH